MYCALLKSRAIALVSQVKDLCASGVQTSPYNGTPQVDLFTRFILSEKIPSNTVKSLGRWHVLSWLYIYRFFIGYCSSS